jgi:mRNA interferase MazF
MVRGELWWASLGMPAASEPGYRRPVLVVQSDLFNRSAIRTIVCLGITTNLDIGRAPGNVALPAKVSGLPRDSVINVSQVVTVDRSFLTARLGTVPQAILRDVERGLRLVLSLG